jgi:hypothetical protein
MVWFLNLFNNSSQAIQLIYGRMQGISANILITYSHVQLSIAIFFISSLYKEKGFIISCFECVRAHACVYV